MGILEQKTLIAALLGLITGALISWAITSLLCIDSEAVEAEDCNLINVLSEKLHLLNARYLEALIMLENKEEMEAQLKEIADEIAKTKKMLYFSVKNYTK